MLDDDRRAVGFRDRRIDFRRQGFDARDRRTKCSSSASSPRPSPGECDTSGPALFLADDGFHLGAPQVGVVCPAQWQEAQIAAFQFAADWTARLGPDDFEPRNVPYQEGHQAAHPCTDHHEQESRQDPAGGLAAGVAAGIEQLEAAVAFRAAGRICGVHTFIEA